MVADVPESADETPGPATSLFGRLMHRVTGIREREATEPEHATVEPVVPPTPKAGDDGDLPAPAKTAVIKGPTVVEPEPEPEVSVEPYVVAVVLPPDAPETDAWEAVGVKHVADESPPAEETVAAAPRVFRFSQPVEHKEVVIRASGSKRRGGPLRGSDGGYVEVVTGSL
ncbi:hypothetical protein AMK68_03645 [candidate division KD3-62 bacterium DG_56]|uniref:Uncharacterized protein n=1 Tax=candidate division KD3-62 bacterium DG_56 TaxID=1704032 RepID=A0A0S7XP25_9BACT|nr:MAG: hypothetical protein AMK68_03645 [candidate division KD3-62 bacterium DG_56]